MSEDSDSISEMTFSLFCLRDFKRSILSSFPFLFCVSIFCFEMSSVTFSFAISLSWKVSCSTVSVRALTSLSYLWYCSSFSFILWLAVFMSFSSSSVFSSADFLLENSSLSFSLSYCSFFSLYEEVSAAVCFSVSANLYAMLSMLLCLTGIRFSSSALRFILRCSFSISPSRTFIFDEFAPYSRSIRIFISCTLVFSETELFHSVFAV